MSLNAMTLTTANAPAVAAFARLVGYSCTQLRTSTFTPTEPATAPAPALARALARVRLSPSTSTKSTTSMTTTTSAHINASSSAIANAALAATIVTADGSAVPTPASIASSAVAAIDTVRDAATAACAFVVGHIAHVVSCCAQLSLPMCYAKSALAQSKPSPSKTGSPLVPPRIDLNSTIRQGPTATASASDRSLASPRSCSTIDASAASTASASARDSFSAPLTDSTATITTTTTSTTQPSTSAIATAPATTTATTPPLSASPATTRRAWPVVRPWAGVADIGRTTMATRRYRLPDAEAREHSHRLHMLQITEPEQDEERYWHAVDTQFHATRAAQRLAHTAAHQSDEPPHEDPPMYACRCGHCPNDTAAYALCAAATIRSNLVQLSRVNRATASVASESLQRQSACFRRARCVFSPTRG